MICLSSYDIEPLGGGGVSGNRAVLRGGARGEGGCVLEGVQVAHAALGVVFIGGSSQFVWDTAPACPSAAYRCTGLS